jgi:uncharacterized protein YdeI (YjbR/CyaY-like superfamily)
VKPKFFRSPVELRQWFASNHATADELIVGYYKKSTGKAGLTWPESVDEALCVGWIDGVRHRLDDERYTNRFTPRRPGSVWSAVNVQRVEALIAERRMLPAGLAAYEKRKENRSGIYSYEQRPRTLPAAYLALLEKNRRAWAFFQRQPPSRRRALTWWVISAKKEETRMTRLEALIRDCATGRLGSSLVAPSTAAKRRKK